MCARCELLRASEALRLGSSISASRPSRGVQLVGGTTTESACAVHFSLSSPSLPSHPRAGSNRLRPLARVERHRTRRPQLSRQFVLSARGTTFSGQGMDAPLHGRTVADFRRESSADVDRRVDSRKAGLKLVSVHRFAMRSLGTGHDISRTTALRSGGSTRVGKECPRI